MFADLIRRLTRTVFSAVPEAGRVWIKAFYYFAFRLYLRAKFTRTSRTEFDSAGVPIPPPLLRFRVGETTSSDEFLMVGERCAEFLAPYLRDAAARTSEEAVVLDFGCGCGRTIRWLVRLLPLIEVHGVDVDRDAIAWCGEHFPNGQFKVCQPTPPLSYAASSFDVIYCVSVFTHLDEAMQDVWLTELFRLLRPSGTLIITIHNLRAAAILNSPDREELAVRGFLHRKSAKLRGIVPDWYQTSWHTKSYIVDRLRGNCHDVHYIEVADGSQDIVIARRLGGGSDSSVLWPIDLPAGISN